MKKLITTILAAVIINVCGYSQTNTYTGPAGGTWGTATNWSSGTVPTASNDVLISSSRRVNVFANASAGAVTLSNNNSELVLAGTTLTANSINLTGSSGNNVRIFMDSGTLNLGGGTGSLTTSGGITSWLTVNYGTSVLNLSSANLSYLWMASGINANAQLSITNGQTMNNGVTIMAGGGGTGGNQRATFNLNGGTLNAGAMYFNYAAGNDTSVLNLNSNGHLTASVIQRVFDGTSANIIFNDGTIQNKTGGDLVINKNANASQSMVINLAGTGTHTFLADSGRTITVSSTAVLADKAGEAGTLVKAGAGKMLLSGDNTYTGSTFVNAGTLIVNGSLLSSNIIVSTGSTLGGSGVLQAVTLQGGTLAPGNSPGLLTMASLDASNGNLSFELGNPNTRGYSYDAIDVSSLLTLGSGTTWSFTINGNYAFKLNDSYDLFNWGTLDASAFDSNTLLAALPDLNTANTNLAWSVDNFTTDGTVNVIPEPSVASLMMLSGAALSLFALRKIKNL